MPRHSVAGVVAAVVMLALPLLWDSAVAGGGPIGIDYELRYDNAGIWARSNQVGLELGVVATASAGALWFGNENALGHTFYQTIDSAVLSAAAADVMKLAFSRARPTQGDDPNAWFRGHGHGSFPSGEVTLQAAFVTPFISDYAARDPWIWSLEVLPLYDSIARMKLHAHWQTDVLAGWALGSGFGYWTSRLKVPLVVRVLPTAVTIGIYRRF